MFEFDPKEFPEIEKERAEAYAAVQDWLKLKQRWESVRGNGVALPIEAYADHPAYVGMKLLLKLVTSKTDDDQSLKEGAAYFLSLISNDDNGTILWGGETREQMDSSLRHLESYTRASVRTQQLFYTASAEATLQIVETISFLLWDEAAFSLPISIRMRLEVNHAE